MGKIAAPYGVTLVTTLTLAACMGNIGPAPKGAPGGASPAGTGGTPNPGSGGSALTGGAGSSLPTGTAGVSGTAGNGAGGMGGIPVVLDCSATAPGRSPMRRLTTYEYNNTIRDLLGDTTNPGSALPPQVDSKQNLFGNDADQQSPSALLIEKYQSVAESVAARATASTTALAKLHSCASSVTTSNEGPCARMIATSLAPRAYRRTVATSEIDELVALYSNVRALSTTMTFASGVAAMVEAMFQSPDFLYRVEQGSTVAGNSAVKRVAGREMATRLSYLFWQTMPDTALFQAADAGTLDTNDGVRQQAQKMLDDSRSHPTVAFFFDNLLPIPDLSGLTRDATTFPKWSSSIGVAMRSGGAARARVRDLREHHAGRGAVRARKLAGAPHRSLHVREPVAVLVLRSSTFAAGASVTGTTLTKVGLNTSQRLGLLTLGGMAAGSTISSNTNPVLRGSFIVNKLMCRNIELPVGFTPMAPDPYSGKTARERYSKHSSATICAQCHQYLDPLGFPFENYDAVGQYRATERWTDPATNTTYDTPIDASGAVPGVAGSAKNAVELAQLLATSSEAESCFASHWIRFAYGRSLTDADGCNQQTIGNAFKDAGYNVKSLLLAITQSDGFLYRPAQ